MSGYIVSGDWQATFDNLSLCQKVADQILKEAKSRGARGFVHLGDFKEAFNPVDLRVLNFYLNVFRTFLDAGLEVAGIRGNHDQIGAKTEGISVLDIFRREGVQMFADPTYAIFAGVPTAFLPYYSDPKILQERAIALASASKKGSVLLFHSEVAGAVYDNGIEVKSGFHPDPKYALCVGGHIHRYQLVGKKVHFMGSPFSHGWGEVNQRKYIGHVDGATLHKIATRLPGHYDPTYPGFQQSCPKKIWRNSRVRIPYEVGEGETEAAALSRVTREAEKKYPHAILVPVPKSAGRLGKHEDIGGDISELADFVGDHVPADLKADAAVLKTRAKRLLATVNAARGRWAKIEFVRVYGENYGSFEKFDYRYPQSGLHVIMGRNQDWGASNGAGKSNLLQALSVALWGVSLKQERHDSWIRRGSTGRAFVGAELKIEGKPVEIIRYRRKPELVVNVDGKNIAAGKTSTLVQHDIDALLGVSPVALLNSLYIDQSSVSSFLFGTNADRFKTIQDFVQAEIYDAALKAAKAERSQIDKQISETENQLSELTGEIKGLRYATGYCEDQYLAAKKLYAEAKANYFQQKKSYEKRNDKVQLKRDSTEATLSQMRELATKLLVERTTYASRVHTNEQAIKKFEAFPEVCPYCKSPVDADHLEEEKARLTQEIIENGEKIQDLTVAVDDAKKGIEDLKAAMFRLDTALKDLAEALNDSRNIYKDAKREYEFQLKQKKAEEARTANLEKLQRVQDALSGSLASLRHSAQMAEYIVWVFSREGYVKHAAAQWVPTLSSVAGKYSRMLSDDMITVRFDMTKQGCVPMVENPTGGELLDNQSVGEKRIASMATYLALSELAGLPLLILDEPGEGLDPVNARRFASGITKMAHDRNVAILLVTHNPEILASVKAQSTVEVVKRNGVSVVK